MKKAEKTGVSEGLAKEAAEMEERLKLLRSKMSEFKEQDDSLPRKGGARWRSARGEGWSIETGLNPHRLFRRPRWSDRLR